MTGTSQRFTPHDVSFMSGKDTCAAWLYLPEGVASPVVILGHGLGATREMRLDAFAERFAQAGIAALAFTYRHFGDSGGQPRQLLSIRRQLADWDAAHRMGEETPRRRRHTNCDLGKLLWGWALNHRGVTSSRTASGGSPVRLPTGSLLRSR